MHVIDNTQLQRWLLNNLRLFSKTEAEGPRIWIQYRLRLMLGFRNSWGTDIMRAMTQGGTC